MKMIAVNGSPRKQWNTAKLLEKAVEGAKSAGMDAKLVHLHDLDFKGCASCFGCKRKGGESLGRCALRDALTPLLDEIHGVDALVLGSPVYLMAETGAMRSFMERAVFQYLRYTAPPATFFPRHIRTALVYTMGMPEEMANEVGLLPRLEMSQGFMARIFGHCETMASFDTLQFDDYDAYDSARFDPKAKQARYEEVFPKDLERAFELGRRMALPPLAE